MAQPAVEQGAIAKTVCLLVGGTVRGELNLSDIGAGMSPYPYLLILEQSKSEKLLYDYLQSYQKTVLWQTSKVFRKPMLAASIVPMGQMGQPEEIAATVVFLCSDAASYITDQSLVIDGGYTAT